MIVAQEGDRLSITVWIGSERDGLSPLAGRLAALPRLGLVQPNR